ncbi:MAG: hypothetical protein K9J27_09955 [Bacteroidales bacterium]|nr:hypothetical protein [Bacteroidales bacterium]MCF8334043.1 hypothetical protein [Bacteroidales bacterium]
MKTHYVLFFFTVTMMLAPFISSGQSFDLKGEMRPRLENRHGYKTLPLPDDEPVAFISQRARLNAMYSDEPADWLWLMITFKPKLL